MQELQELKKKISKTLDPTQLKAALCKASLYHFVVYFWDTIISEPMVDNWHIKELCNVLQPHLLRAIRKEKKEADLVVNICPGTTKSTIISQMIPAWCWAVSETTIILTSTNSDKLTAKNAMRSKDVITSEKYKELFPEIIIRKDASAKTFYQNTKGGARYSFTTKGSKIGNHGDILIEDDPTTAKQAKSKVEMEAAEEGYKEFQTRKTNKETSLYILLMQRLSPADYTTIALKKLNKVQQICLPALDSELVKPAIFREYYVDGLLDPVRLSHEILMAEKKALNDDEQGTSEDDYDAQFLQDPQTKQGLVYSLNRYNPKDINYENAINLGSCDAADTGDDYLCAPFAKLIGSKVYIHDVVYTKDGSGITIPLLEVKIKLHRLIDMIIETNNQGSVFVSQLEDKAPQVTGVYSSGNKMNRIIAFAWLVNKYFYFLEEGSEGYTPEYAKFVNTLKTFLKTATKEDDASDGITILAKYLFVNYGYLFKS